jgi:hypothetical protein
MGSSPDFLQWFALDERCLTVTFDPGWAHSDTGVLKAIVRERDNKLGVYGAVIRCGRLAVGQPILLEAPAEHRK